MLTIDEKEAMVSKLKAEFAAILTAVEDAVGQAALHEVEADVSRRLLAVGRSCLDYYLAQWGTGYDVEHPPQATDGCPLTFKGVVASPYVSIFGEVTIHRAAYARPTQGYVYPLDARLNLPASKFSYLVQQEVLERSVDTDFREAVAGVNKRLGMGLGPSMPQRLCADVAPAVESFYAHAAPPAPETEGTHLVLSADGKGVRMLKADRPDAQATELPPKARRGKGEKPGIKKEAVVTVDGSFTPMPRTPEEMVKALLHEFTPADREQAKRDRQQRRDAGGDEPGVTVNKHARATLAGKDTAMASLMGRVAQRDPDGTKQIVVLLDGDPHLETAVHKALTEAHLTDRVKAVILDILHASEYVWDAGTALYGETNPARTGWVRKHLLALLESRGDAVIEAFQQTLTTPDLRPAQAHALQKAITYFTNHRPMMDYATYLTQGYPIATGLVEGTCNSLVKDRMEQSGMRWSLAGAQTVLDLRAVKQNHDWDTFWQFHITAEKARLYGETSNTASYSLAA